MKSPLQGGEIPPPLAAWMDLHSIRYESEVIARGVARKVQEALARQEAELDTAPSPTTTEVKVRRIGTQQIVWISLDRVGDRGFLPHPSDPTYGPLSALKLFGTQVCQELNDEFWGYQERVEALSEMTKGQDIHERLKVVTRHIKRLAQAVGEELLREHSKCIQQQPLTQCIDLTEEQD